MIYSISNSAVGVFNSKYCGRYPTLGEKNAIFYYDRLDWGSRGILFKDMLDPTLWEYFKQDSTTKIIINYYDDFICKIDIDHIAETIKEKQLDATRIFLIVCDNNYYKFATEKFNKLGINLNIQSYNSMLKKIKVTPLRQFNKFSFKKFSMLSRNYRDVRLKFYATLQKADLLSNVSYTFNNIDPYVHPHKVFNQEYITAKIKEFNIEIDEKMDRWIKNIPYSVGNVKDKLDKIIYNLIDQSGINIIIESHFDHFVNHYGPEFSHCEYAPPFVTEKTYKAISRSKPFIFFSAPYSLTALKDLGFKTFDPYIDETYDQIEDNDQRLKIIVTEITRINSMSKKEFNQLIENTREITNYNLSRLNELSNAVKFVDSFDWINPLLK